MTSQQRSEAARRAAATRRANRMNGTTGTRPSASRPRRAAFAPRVDAKLAAFEALAKLEDALVAKATEQGITPEMGTAFERFQKIKARALAPGTPGEGAVALRMATIELVKLVY